MIVEGVVALELIRVWSCMIKYTLYFSSFICILKLDGRLCGVYVEFYNKLSRSQATVHRGGRWCVEALIVWRTHSVNDCHLHCCSQYSLVRQRRKRFPNYFWFVCLYCQQNRLERWNGPRKGQWDVQLHCATLCSRFISIAFRYQKNLLYHR